MAFLILKVREKNVSICWILGSTALNSLQGTFQCNCLTLPSLRLFEWGGAYQLCLAFEISRDAVAATCPRSQSSYKRWKKQKISLNFANSSCHNIPGWHFFFFFSREILQLLVFTYTKAGERGAHKHCLISHCQSNLAEGSHMRIFHRRMKRVFRHRNRARRKGSHK